MELRTAMCRIVASVLKILFRLSFTVCRRWYVGVDNAWHCQSSVCRRLVTCVCVRGALVFDTFRWRFYLAHTTCRFFFRFSSFFAFCHISCCSRWRRRHRVKLAHTSHAHRSVYLVRQKLMRKARVGVTHMGKKKMKSVAFVVYCCHFFRVLLRRQYKWQSHHTTVAPMIFHFISLRSHLFPLSLPRHRVLSNIVLFRCHVRHKNCYWLMYGCATRAERMKKECE